MLGHFVGLSNIIGRNSYCRVTNIQCSLLMHMSVTIQVLWETQVGVALNLDNLCRWQCRYFQDGLQTSNYVEGSIRRKDLFRDRVMSGQDG